MPAPAWFEGGKRRRALRATPFPLKIIPVQTLQNAYGQGRHREKLGYLSPSIVDMAPVPDATTHASWSQHAVVVTIGITLLHYAGFGTPVAPADGTVGREVLCFAALVPPSSLIGGWPSSRRDRRSARAPNPCLTPKRAVAANFGVDCGSLSHMRDWHLGRVDGMGRVDGERLPEPADLWLMAGRWREDRPC